MNTEELFDKAGPEEEPETEPAETAVSEPEKPADETVKTEPANTEEPKKAPVKPPKKRKKRTVSLFMAIIAALFAALLAAQITFICVKRNFDRKLASIQLNQYSDQKLSLLDYIYRKNYIHDIDEEKLNEGLIEGYIYGTGDKYGNYMSAKEYEDYRQTLNAKMDGIGVSVIWDAEKKAVEIIYVYENSPAEAAGIIQGDFITGVDGKASADLGYDQTIASIRGERGTKVELTVQSGADTKKVSVERAPIEIKTVKYRSIEKIGLISITDFYSDTPEELKKAVEALKAEGCDRLIFDMRNNPGGLLDAVVASLDYLLPEGVIVRTVSADGKEKKYESDASCVDMPMVAIVNGNTASAAELFTSSLRDYGKVTVIGTKTYGKGTVTAPYALGDGSVVYVSMMLYYPPKSDNFEGKGITPDIELDLSEEAKKINFNKLTYEQDDQLKKAVEVIKNK